MRGFRPVQFASKRRAHIRSFSSLIDGLHNKECRYIALRKTIVDAKPSDQPAEVLQRQIFEDRLRDGSIHTATGVESQVPSSLDSQKCKLLLQAGFASFQLHVEARIAAMLGEGFYTIGPCGEEMTATFGLQLNPHGDTTALHYRHLPAQIARQLVGGIPLDEVLLDRARGYTCSVNDSVTGAAHCALGGGPLDFYVTSTLASQAPPAVGRALAAGIASSYLPKDEQRFAKDMVSLVSVGDGSVNNAMFLAATNMADYAQHRSFKCPVLFTITNNDLCISLRGHGWLKKFLKRQLMPVFEASADDLFGSWSASEQAINYVRTQRRPAILAYHDVPRRFGHAASDRQFAYLSQDEISKAAGSNPLESACRAALNSGLVESHEELYDMWMNTRHDVERAFDIAVDEDKLTSREDLNQRVSAPLAELPRKHGKVTTEADVNGKKGQVMRKSMTQVYMEAMDRDSSVVYLGEDVRHGGYYLVTEGLADRFGHRVIDFPPDETSLVGAGMGFAQAGMTPVVEIPYAKYLDCAADMFFEAVLSNWATNGRQPNGMVIRLQGFDRGVFGGNFHTHNTLHLPPGLDVVCFSNGPDYVRGLRHALLQAKAGRVVMLVDSTDLLNRRHLLPSDKDSLWMAPYPQPLEDTEWVEEDLNPFSDVTIYTPTAVRQQTGLVGVKLRTGEESAAFVSQQDDVKVVVITYGNGVPQALEAAKQREGIAVVDCPYLTPGQLPESARAIVSNAHAVVFADVCKFGQHPFAASVCELQKRGELPAKWQTIGSQPTYNPLGRTLTFLSAEDILGACSEVLR